MPYSPIHWRHEPFQCHHMRESKRQLAQTPPFNWGPPYTHIYLLAYLPTSGNDPLRFNHIGMCSPICPVLVKQWCIVPGWRPLTPCTLRSWMPCTLPTKVSPVWKLTPQLMCIGPACRPVLSSATNNAHCVMPLLSSSQPPLHASPLQTPIHVVADYIHMAGQHFWCNMQTNTMVRLSLCLNHQWTKVTHGCYWELQEWLGAISKDWQDYKSHKKTTVQAIRHSHWRYVNSVLFEGLESKDTKPWHYTK